ncbi:Os02g0714801 [Oryza sativa Japonica Group]|uniref:Os02g0714801 protein n=1 Tax=Oryza sativa subsp. japonica TaxID=39947 RepID=A0A0P0VNX7_ORYSJ|nr:hypothetical protein EE612_013272 [Oryza sativa]BAS80599.1 Os02g0714801 [Oryza sativa Japonica Group]
MASCGEGLLFYASDPPAAAWAPIAAMADCNASSINYSGGEFFVFEDDVCYCCTTIVDALTLPIAAVIPVPAVELPAEARIAVAGDELFLLIKSKGSLTWPDRSSPASAAAPCLSIPARICHGDRGIREPRGQHHLLGDHQGGERSAFHHDEVQSVFSLENRSFKKLACCLNKLEMALCGETPSWIIPSWNEG